jgi:hypothetical protein
MRKTTLIVKEIRQMTRLLREKLGILRGIPVHISTEEIILKIQGPSLLVKLRLRILKNIRIV